MNTFISVCIIFVFFIAIVKIGGYREPPNSTEEKEEQDECEEYSIEDVSAQLNIVNRIMEQINTIESMITDIKMCEPGEHEKNIKIRWSDEKYGNQEYNFLVSGADLNTDMLLEMAYSERNRLRSLMNNEIRILGERSNENCYDNYENLNRGEVKRICRKQNFAKAAD